jgi:hypothetical protein
MWMEVRVHESLVAPVREHLADTYLGSETATEHVEEVSRKRRVIVVIGLCRRLVSRTWFHRKRLKLR